MHVAINAYFWNQPFTGSGQYTRQLVLHLNRFVSDLEITLVFPQTDGVTEPEKVPPSVGVRIVHSRAGHAGKVLFEQVHFPRACREVGASLAHVPYWGGPLRSPVPLLITVHDLTTLLVPQYRRSFQARLYNALVTASARGANHIITDSFSSKLDILDYLHIPEQDVTAIYLAAGSQFTPSENSLTDLATLRKYDLPDFYVLYLGGYAIHKNVKTLLHAYKYVSEALGEEYPLILAGKKPEAVSDSFPDYDGTIQNLALEKNVRWIGTVDEEDKPVLYRNAEVFVFPSQYEGFGLGPLEAMACGTAVVTSNCTSLPEVVGPAAFAIDADDEREMAGAIIATVMEDPLRTDMRRKGLDQARKFSWQKTATETAQVYDQVYRDSLNSDQ